MHTALRNDLVGRASWRPLLDSAWADWRIGLAVAVVLAASAGLIASWLTPRGPVTTPQALASMAAALLVGIAAGLTTGRHWSMLLTPAVFVMAFELARLSVDGPTVDGIHLGSPYGIIAFVLGRLFHWVLVLVPMILGSVLGVWLAGRLGYDGARTLGVVGWILSVLYPQLQGIDLRHDVPRLSVPVYMVIGQHEARGRSVLADGWFAMLEAPSKERIVFAHSGHRPLFEEPGVFTSVMTSILDDTYVGNGQGPDWVFAHSSKMIGTLGR